MIKLINSIQECYCMTRIQPVVRNITPLKQSSPMEMLKKWVFEYLTAFFLIKSKKYKKVYKKDNFQIKIIFFSYSTTLIQLCLSLITN